MYDVWHDRALFHFLIEPQQRQQYVEAVTRTGAPQGTVIIATIAPDGPPSAVVWRSVVTTSGAWQPSSQSRSPSSRQCVRRALSRGVNHPGSDGGTSTVRWPPSNATVTAFPPSATPHRPSLSR